MCMITYLAPGVEVPVAGIRNGASWNDDGHGWAIAAEPGVMLRERYMDAETALSTFVASRAAYPDAPALFHSRWATHGTTNVANVHPFPVGGMGSDVVVAHNGILPKTFHPLQGDKRSDTRIMADEWLASMTRGGFSRRERKRIGQAIGTGNKLAILSVSPALDKPRGFLVNGHLGVHMNNGVWYSNRDYLYYWTPKEKYSWIGGGYTGGTGKTGNGYSTSGSVNVNYVSTITDTSETHSFEDSRKTNRSEWALREDECPWCFSYNVDLQNNVCRVCDTCLDCMVPLMDCMCRYGPESGTSKALARIDDEDGYVS